MPALWPENVMAYNAFWELGPERINGFGEGYIPRRDIRDYAIDEELDFQELFWKVRAMDRVYLEHQREKSDQENRLEEAKSEQAHRVKGRRGRG